MCQRKIKMEMEISSHARERFLKRWEEETGGKINNPEKVIYDLLSVAHEVEWSGSLSRTIHKLRYGRMNQYLRAGRWIFVIDRNQRIVLTVYRQRPGQFKKKIRKR